MFMQKKGMSKKVQQKEEKKLRILVASDVHGNARIMKKLAERAYKEKVDVVVLCGDLTDLTPTAKA